MTACRLLKWWYSPMTPSKAVTFSPQGGLPSSRINTLPNSPVYTRDNIYTQLHRKRATYTYGYMPEGRTVWKWIDIMIKKIDTYTCPAQWVTLHNAQACFSVRCFFGCLWSNEMVCYCCQCIYIHYLVWYIFYMFSLTLDIIPACCQTYCF